MVDLKSPHRLLDAADRSCRGIAGAPDDYPTPNEQLISDLASQLAKAEALLRLFAAKADAWEARRPLRGRYPHRDATQISHRLGDFRAALAYFEEP